MTAPKPEQLLKLCSTVDDIGRVNAMINQSPPDYPGLPDLRKHLAELEERVKKEAREYVASETTRCGCGRALPCRHCP